MNLQLQPLYKEKSGSTSSPGEFQEERIPIPHTLSENKEGSVPEAGHTGTQSLSPVLVARTTWAEVRLWTIAASSLSFSSFLSSFISFRKLLFSLLSWVFLLLTCKGKQGKQLFQHDLVLFLTVFIIGGSLENTKETSLQEPRCTCLTELPQSQVASREHLSSGWRGCKEVF
jgi:hypothetical protein